MLKKFSFIFALLFPLSINLTPATATAKSTPITFVADIWADNWFSLYINGKKVGQDSVPITTTKSFNKETITFSATYPLTIGLIGKDYVENNSGLEYIGTDRQQIGDAGIILQIHEKVSKKFVVGTNSSWKSLVTFKAPLNQDCELSNNPIQDCTFALDSYPTNWSSATFKDTKWGSAYEFSEAEVGVKEGYLEVNWESAAKLIWSQNLKTDNTVLFRKVVNQPMKTSTTFSFSLSGVGVDHKLLRDFTCDGAGKAPEVFWNHPPENARYISLFMTTEPGPPRAGETESSIHYEWVLYNVPVELLRISSMTNQGQLGVNFQNRSAYAPPCSQGPGEKVYTFTMYAHAEKIFTNNDSKALQTQAKSQALSTASQNYTYARS